MDNRQGDVADAVGMPDEQDYKTLHAIISKYEARHPGLIKRHLDEGRREFGLGVHHKNLTWKGDAVVNKQANMKYVFSLPPDLYKRIETVFPSMFKSKKHLGWFRRNFYKITISGEAPK